MHDYITSTQIENIYVFPRCEQTSDCMGSGKMATILNNFPVHIS